MATVINDTGVRISNSGLVIISFPVLNNSIVILSYMYLHLRLYGRANNSSTIVYKNKDGETGGTVAHTLLSLHRIAISIKQGVSKVFALRANYRTAGNGLGHTL